MDSEESAVISDARAQTLASYWADPRDPLSPISQLARDGAISEETIETLRHDLGILETASEGSSSVAQGQLAALLDYALSHGPRGPVSGWGDLRDHARFSDDIAAEEAIAEEPIAEELAEEEEEEEEPAPVPAPAIAEEEVSALDLPFPGGWEDDDEEE